MKPSCLELVNPLTGHPQRGGQVQQQAVTSVVRPHSPKLPCTSHLHHPPLLSSMIGHPQRGGEIQQQAPTSVVRPHPLALAAWLPPCCSFPPTSPPSLHSLWLSLLPTSTPHQVIRNEVGKYNSKRLPAWCDRILWRSLPGCQLACTRYDAAHDVGSSDHKPVLAEFELTTHALPVGLDPADAALVAGEGAVGTVGAVARRLQRSASSRHSGDMRWHVQVGGRGVSYVRFTGPNLLHSTHTKPRYKTLNPVWTPEDISSIVLENLSLQSHEKDYLLAAILDHDVTNQDDPIGFVTIPLAPAVHALRANKESILTKALLSRGRADTAVTAAVVDMIFPPLPKLPAGDLLPLIQAGHVASIWHDVLLVPPQLAQSSTSRLQASPFLAASPNDLLFPSPAAETESDDFGGNYGTADDYVSLSAFTFVCTSSKTSSADHGAKGGGGHFPQNTRSHRRKSLSQYEGEAPLVSPSPCSLSPDSLSPRSTRPALPCQRLDLDGSLSPDDSAPRPWNLGIMPQTCVLSPVAAQPSDVRTDGSDDSPPSSPSIASAGPESPRRESGDSSFPVIFDNAPIEALEIGTREREPGEAYPVLPLLALPMRLHNETRSEVSWKLVVIAIDDPLVSARRMDVISRKLLPMVRRWVRDSGFASPPRREKEAPGQVTAPSRANPSRDPLASSLAACSWDEAARKAREVITEAHCTWKLISERKVAVASVGSISPPV
ncbi:unnamed protein product [Closterium sp. Yama58-4]|nr:unnamed protein product [Closterium sp. Yama58-4]